MSCFISFIFFADDIVPFVEATIGQAKVIHQVLDKFCVSSR